MGSSEKRDVFIMYTKADSYESSLVEAIKDQLYNWGLTAWVYEDWDWENENQSGPRWRSDGRIDQLDLVRYAMHHPEPFKHRPKGPEVDRGTLARMFEQSGTIILVAPRAVSLSPGTFVEVEVLKQNPHPRVASVSWHKENECLVKELNAFFDYRMQSAFPRDVCVAGESVARLAWLACMMSHLADCGPMGRDVFRQLARSDLLLNRIAEHSLRPVQVPLEADPLRPSVLSDEATPESCAPVLEFWHSGPGFTADSLTSGKPPTEIVQASKLMRNLLRDWCAKALQRFPALGVPAAKISFPLAAAKMRLGKFRDAIEEFTRALDAPDSQKLRTNILFNRGLAWAERSFPGKAIDDYTKALNDATLDRDIRNMVLRNRSIVWSDAGKFDEAAKDLEEILSTRAIDARTESLVLISRALLRIQAEELDEAIADYDRILQLKKAPVEARLKALLNRGALYARMERHGAAICDYDDLLKLCEVEPRQIGLAFFNRAISKAALNDRAGALADYQSALKQPDLDKDLRSEIDTRMAALRSKSGAR